ESAHARSLLDLLAEAGAGPRPEGDSELARRERELRLKLNAKAARQATVGSAENAVLAKQIDGLSVALRAGQSELRLRNPRYAAPQPHPLDWAQVQGQLLDDATVLVEYTLGERRSYVFAGTREGLIAAELPPRPVIEAGARQFHRLASGRDT